MLRVRFFSSDIVRRYLPRRSVRLITRLLRSPGALFSSDTPPRRNIFLPNLSSLSATPLFQLSRRLPVSASRTALRCVSRKRPVSVPFRPVSTCFRPFSPVATGSRCCLALVRDLLLPLGSRCCTTPPETRCHPSPVFFRGRCIPGPAVPRSPVSPLCSLYSLYHSDAA